MNTEITTTARQIQRDAKDGTPDTNRWYSRDGQLLEVTEADMFHAEGTPAHLTDAIVIAAGAHTQRAIQDRLDAYDAGYRGLEIALQAGLAQQERDAEAEMAAQR
ncbi:hypothetical protein FYJ24_06790 [Actinomycetaceae bacterium WB03_NA08]|uniref:Uncharacterized protein n=1 Tax=Scrofimicrobium canadense TaxID=2652290 RepID=A0A6N7W7K0_9ACTO|nr:hypothetical protein [Scrofimicrobium canadense]MSS84473.1 hypothetical protein [Scrofimicrobium canadense]